MSKQPVIYNIPKEPVCGIYSLTDSTGKMYIGSSSDIRRRVREHRFHINSYLREGIDGVLNPKMKAAVANGERFRCDVLASFSCPMSNSEMREIERVFIHKFGDMASLYNCLPISHKV